MLAKRVSVPALTALTKALATTYWYKEDLQSFAFKALPNHVVLTVPNWDGPKRDTAKAIVDYLAANQDRYLFDILTLMRELSAVIDFSHFARIDDGDAKAAVALSNVKALQILYLAHDHLSNDKETAEANRKREEERAAKVTGRSKKLSELNETFTQLLTSSEPQKRGYKLETLLNELFALFDLEPSTAFRIAGEQIDGALRFEGNHYLLEAKWQKQPIGAQELDGLSGKVKRKLNGTLGLYVSIYGFSADGITAHSQGEKNLILVDGQDIVAVLEARIDLPTLLRQKHKHASLTGDVFLPVNRILYG